MSENRAEPAAGSTGRPANDLARAERAFTAGRLGEAAGICEDILARQSDNAPALALLGTIYGRRGRIARGLELVEKAAALDPESPRFQQTLSGFYRQTYRFDDAVAAVRRAAALKPNDPRILLDLGKTLMDRIEVDEALSAFLSTLIHDPDNPEAHLAIGQILLARGEMKAGWVEYEWRNKLPMAKGTVPEMKAPAWNGMRLGNRTLLIIGDQGFGDQIQFSRYIPMAAERCQKLVLASPADLVALLGGVPGVAQIESRWERIPPHSCHLRLSSLPMIFGTEADTIPAPIPYLAADPGDIAAWKERLDARVPAGRRRVGIVWSGRPTHPNDRRRSMRLADLAPLAAVEGISFVSLQKVVPAHGTLATFPDLADVAVDLTDFAQTAAAIMNLDLVIAIDTAVGHLAGALGRPAWLMLPRPCDWRWSYEREDTPWYPSLRLFRQTQPGDWGSVVARIAASLAAWDPYGSAVRPGRPSSCACR